MATAHPKRAVVSGDIVEHGARRSRLLDAEHKVISVIARGQSLRDVLATACQELEALVPGALCSILLLDDSRTKFHLGAAPSLPASYNDALEGLEIGPMVGSCGTAAYTRQTVIVSDISTDPKWAPFQDLASAHGLAACWSIPLLDAAQAPLGTFAVYRRTPHVPDDAEIAVAKVLSDAVSVGIARHLDQEALIRSRDELEARVGERTAALETATREAVRANTFKTRFLAAASHDMRQPLQAAGAYLAAAAHRIADESARASLDRIRQPLATMDSILNSLLDISRLESGAVIPDIRDFWIDELIARSIATYGAAAAEKNLKLTVTHVGEVVRSDPDLIERVLDNLLANAIRYTDRGEVKIFAERQAAHLRLLVNDTGIGIPGDKLDLIFEEYVQLDNPARDRRKGFGFGLALVKLIAKALGHPIHVTSSPGAGSTFSIELPLASAPARPAAADVSPAPPAEARDNLPKVLLIEDDPDCAYSLQEYLNTVGFDTVIAGHGNEALRLIVASYRPDLVISDYRLPGEDGIAVIRRVRQALNSDIPAVLLSGDTSLNAAALKSLPACAFMRKPALMDKFTGLVRNMLVARALAN
jgi:signal transduction histidine kinase/ActR/RegA family two-component response regulator